MRRTTIYISEEDERLIEDVCRNLSVSKCFKKLLREYKQFTEMSKLQKKIDDILTLLRSQQNNTRQENTLDTFLKKHR